MFCVPLLRTSTSCVHLVEISGAPLADMLSVCVCVYVWGLGSWSGSPFHPEVVWEMLFHAFKGHTVWLLWFWVWWHQVMSWVQLNSTVVVVVPVWWLIFALQVRKVSAQWTLQLSGLLIRGKLSSLSFCSSKLRLRQYEMIGVLMKR